MYIYFIKIKINFEQKVRLVHTIIFAFIYIIIYPESVRIDKKRIAGFSECALDLRSFVSRTYLFCELARSVSRWSPTCSVSLRNNETRRRKRGRHAPTSSLFLTALSREYPPEFTLCLAPRTPLFPLATPLTRVVTLSEYWNFPTARFHRLGGRRHFATYFACPLTRVWSKIAGTFLLSEEKSIARRKMRKQSNLNINQL